MRVYASIIAIVAGIAAAACSDATPAEPLSAPATVSLAAVPGTGNPAVDSELATLNNQVVGCAITGNLDPDSASRIALLTAILRFTPSGSDNKTEALLGAIAQQIENAQRKGEISPACYAQLTSTIGSIEGML
jgi:hypothetical protein